LKKGSNPDDKNYALYTQKFRKKETEYFWKMKKYRWFTLELDISQKIIPKNAANANNVGLSDKLSSYLKLLKYPTSKCSS
jgi:hypothetical protein